VIGLYFRERERETERETERERKREREKRLGSILLKHGAINIHAMSTFISPVVRPGIEKQGGRESKGEIKNTIVPFLSSTWVLKTINQKWAADTNTSMIENITQHLKKMVSSKDLCARILSSSLKKTNKRITKWKLLHHLRPCKNRGNYCFFHFVMQYKTND